MPIQPTPLPLKASEELCQQAAGPTSAADVSSGHGAGTLLSEPRLKVTAILVPSLDCESVRLLCIRQKAFT